MTTKLSDIVSEFQLKVYAGEEEVNNLVSGAYVSDLLSDVMGNAKEGDLWITLQTHKNILAVASLKELPAIICVKNLVPNEETIEAANREKIVILGTNLTTFEIAGLLYNFLKQ